MRMDGVGYGFGGRMVDCLFWGMSCERAMRR